MLRFLTVLFFVAFSYTAYSQAPRILSVDKDHGAMGETITLRGSGFGTDPSKLQVFFGAVEGTVLTTANNLVEVEVPEGATHDYISLRNSNTKLIGYSSTQFYISFSGTSEAISANDFAAQHDTPSKDTGSPNLYNFCMCDFKKDGKPDVATANNGVNYITVMINNSANPGSFGFTRKFPNLFAKTAHINCSDFDGDGNYDLVASEDGGASRLFFLKGDGTGDFTTPAEPYKILTGSLIRQIQIADINLDGKPDILLSDWNIVNGIKQVLFLKNESDNSGIKFSDAISIPIPIVPSAGTDALQVEDIDNDNLPDIIVSPTQNSNIFIVRNNSSVTNIQFDTPIVLNVTGAITGLKVGDLDSDGKADIAASKLATTQLSILKNNSTPGNISFGSPIQIPVELENSWGLDFGDLNGDGILDIVIPHTKPSSTTTPIKSKLTILENKGGLTFQKTSIEKNDVSRYVRVGDMDKDGKPDIVGASVDIFVSGLGSFEPSSIFILRNLRCFQPKITPEGPINICSTDPVKLTSIKGGSSYQWKKDDVDITGKTTNELNNIVGPLATSNFKVVATTLSPRCTSPIESNTVSVTITSAAGISTVPIVPNPTPACTGNSTVTLTASASGVDFHGYKWEGPNSFSSNNATATIPSSGDLTLGHAGYYSISYLGPGGCVLKSEKVKVDVIEKPTFTIGTTNGSTICSGQSTRLVLSPSPSSIGYTYQWFRKNNDNSTTSVGNNNQDFEANSAGKFYASIQGACPTESDLLEVSEKPALTASFTIPTVACANEEILFQNNTTEPEPLKYTWTFGDGQTATEKSPMYKYSNPSPGYSVKLIVSYADNACASAPAIKTINILAAPAVQIVTASGKNQICKGGEIDLSVTGATINAYNWNTGETTSSIKATNAEVYKVNVKTSSGCSLTAEKTLTFFDDTQVTITADPPSVDPGDPVQLSVEGLVSPEWSPIETLSDPKSTSPIAIPATTTEYSVKGIDENGCERTTTITIKVDPKSMVSFLSPKNFFSPNSDAIDDIWNIENIENFPACGVTIYDEKGVKVFEAKPYNNDWNGTFKGSNLPDGVYYYIIRCDGEESTPKAGSLTLLR
ncbi:FG-GAP-like repeat-containing protein [Chryseosolibacter indicus]|uniref:VCBS repeat-containing protein n=1 Tax=Chryseosolibacter indicus TaxID=2782351 RepID=A0ABS5VP97_9BACT|nr:FG-GAP-like repeat-containing protein [Chryseosolibacter indicus]MBT1703272.1 VCBS repeat-containing protein [Chryseosolibacter indicus]